MRWKWPERNTRRIRRQFLLLPRRVGNEWRWLEYAVWEEKAVYEGDRQLTGYKWIPQNWIDVCFDAGG